MIVVKDLEHLKKRIDETLLTHKTNLKRFRDQKKTNNEEIFNVMNKTVRGEKPDVDNVTEHLECCG